MLINKYLKIYTLELIRNKSAAFFTIIFPTILLLLFSKNVPPTENAQWSMLISLANYAVQCAMLQALGMGIAFSNHRKWSEYVKILPASGIYSVIGRVLAMLLFAMLSLLLVLIAGIFWMAFTVSYLKLSIVFFVALAGGIPMGILGFYLGKMISPAAARSLFVLINIALFFAAFCFPDHGWLSFVRTFIPSYQWLTLSYDLAMKHSLDYLSLIGLAGYTATFFVLAVYATRK